MNCTSIDQVIKRLDNIVEECKQNQNPQGYFAVLYRKVTIRVRLGIASGEFEDNQRMEQLDVNFANRYFEAYDAYQSNKPCTQSWQVAFDANKESGHTILQYLLLGINAHINLDLGIATINTVANHPIAMIQKDFNTINSLLSELVDDVKTNIGKVSPIFKVLMPLAKQLDEKLINFSIEVARDGAWKFVNELANNRLDPSSIKMRDDAVAFLARQLRNPGKRLTWINQAIALAEWRTVANNLKILEESG